MIYVLKASSRSKTTFSSLIRMVVRLGNASVGVLCAVTRAGNPSPSRTASTTPAVNEEQLSWLISRGTETLRVMGGSLSITIYSSGFSTLFSIASAGFPNTVRHTCVWMDIRAGRNRISRLGVFEEDSFLHDMSSSTRAPTRYPKVFSLRSRSAIPLTRFCVYCTTSEKRKANAEAETSAVRVLLRLRS